MKAEPRQLFLLDALGATLSTILLGAVLTTFNPIFGMPVSILRVLAGIAALYALYSFWQYFRFPEKWSFFLRVIALANIFYCGLTLHLVLRHYPALTLWGRAYFFGELILVLVLATVEYQTARKGQA
ncbi:MAG TPA: hypothetical protein VJ953_20730 [Saprospiraceae bacterium]|nr:hypothetical protein [Saprospiraceae bacterium]